MEKALNGQINAELYSSYLYYSMSAWFESKGLPGFANWMNCQVQEEMAHARKFYDFINQRGGRVTLTAIDGPETEWDSPLAVIEATLAHEQKVTALINGLLDLALDERDHATNIFLQWFVTEQVEEEDSVNSVLQQLKQTGVSEGGLFLVDRELAKRVFTPPSKTDA